MTWLWIAAAFIAGMAFTWYVAGRVAVKALGHSPTLAHAMNRMSYDGLLRLRAHLDREIVKRRAPFEGES